ncbi:MAG: hypothetical protein CMJ49_08035 [Planctomycetaceae bacterium]|nr:hypothetical protein [Planctomycetaceae bacterium]
MHTEIQLKNELRIRRESEWLCRGVPFPQGALTDVSALSLQDESGGQQTLATEALGHWPDGSVKWALLQFPVSFEHNGSRTLTLHWPRAGAGDKSGSTINLSKFETEWEVNNGRLTFRLPMSGQALLTRLQANGTPVAHDIRAQVQDESGVTFTGELNSEPAIEHLTDKMLVISRRGIHRDVDGNKYFSFVFRLTVFADADDIEVEYQFVHDEPFRHAPPPAQIIQGVGSQTIDTDHPGMRELRSVRLVLRHGIDSPTEYVTCPLCTVDEVGLVRSAEPMRILLTQAPKIGLYDAMIDGEVLVGDKRIGTSHGWVGLSDGARGLSASVRSFGQQWPKGITANAHDVVIELWPESAGPLHIYQGQAKTHGVKLRAFDGPTSQVRLPDWHFAYQFPIVLSAPQWYIGSGAVGSVFHYQPEKYPGIERRFRLEFEQFLGHDRLLGMMDYGDYESLGEASWGRRGNFMSNLEHDFAQAVWLQFVRTGSYRYMDYFDAGVRHVLDVDIVHFDDQDDQIGGWRVHGSLHAAPDCDLSHSWAESLVSHYYYTGYTPSLAAARGVADWMVRRIEHDGQGRIGARDRGWPLIALSTVYQATRDALYAQAAKKIVESFTDGPDPLEANGGLSGGYGPIPFQQAVMGSIAATGLAYYHQTFGGKPSRHLFLTICDWLCSDAVLGRDGLYEAMPGNETSMAYAAYSNFRESLGYAWELTGDTKYVVVGVRDMADNMASTVPTGSVGPPLTVKYGYEVVCATGTRMSTFWRENLRFMSHADKAGLLQDF